MTPAVSPSSDSTIGRFPVASGNERRQVIRQTDDERWNSEHASVKSNRRIDRDHHFARDEQRRERRVRRENADIGTPVNELRVRVRSFRRVRLDREVHAVHPCNRIREGAQYRFRLTVLGYEQDQIV